jgi:hypothetical protein
MADDIPSQGRFIGWLALVLLGVALLFALVVLWAGNSVPPANL